MPGHADAANAEVQHEESDRMKPLERRHHALGHRRRHELVRVRNAFVRRPDDALSHRRFGRRRARSDAASRATQRRLAAPVGANAVGKGPPVVPGGPTLSKFDVSEPSTNRNRSPKSSRMLVLQFLGAMAQD